MRLLAIRHGETEWNLERRYMGQSNSPLSARGLLQAEAIARRLQSSAPFVLYTSDLGRAVQTATTLAAYCQCTFVEEPGLRERHMGVFQGHTWEEIQRKFPEESREYKELRADYAPPDGESALERTERSVRVLTGLAERHPAETVVVVTHGSFLQGFFEFVLGLPPSDGRRFKRSNASFSSFLYEGGAWSLETWNDVSHLAQVGVMDARSVIA